MDVRSSLKESTALAKSGDYDAAIGLLKTIIEHTRKLGGYSDSTYTKIIPYFQKAGRYDEGVRFTLSVLMEAIQEDKKNMFSHKVAEISEASYLIGQSKIYSSLALASKRENRLDQHAKFMKLSETKFKAHRLKLEEAQDLQLRKDYEEYKKVSNCPPSQWRDIMKKNFQKLIEEDLEKEKSKSFFKKVFSKLFNNN